jgi:hypothetical protein
MGYDCYFGGVFPCNSIPEGLSLNRFVYEKISPLMFWPI